jgi:hypothetical protein
MNGERIENAVQRIEAALARIAGAADAVAPQAPSVSSLVVKHEALRETVSATLKELDDLIGAMER